MTSNDVVITFELVPFLIDLLERMAMAIYTPRGLKIHVPTDVGFALMTFVSSGYSPSMVLRTVEALNLLPAIVSSLAAIAAFHVSDNLMVVGEATVVAYALAYGLKRTLWISYLGVFFWLAEAFSSPAGLTALRIWVLAVAWLEAGWQGVVTYVVSRGITMAMTVFFELGSGAEHDGTMVTDTSTVRDFVTVYRRYARKLDMVFAADIEDDVDDHSLHPSIWRPTFNNYRSEFPVAADLCSEPPERELYESEDEAFMRRWCEERGLEYDPATWS